MTRNLRTIFLTLLAALALLTGCGDDTTTAPVVDQLTADKDVAEAVAADLGSDDGGLADQLSDLSISLDGLSAAKLDPADFMGPRNGFVSRDYDEATGTWTVTIDRERGDPEGTPYARIDRVYTLRFLDEAGEPMQFRVVDEDTARTVEFDIVSGSGEHRTRRMEQELTELSGSLVVTGVNTDIMTVNGNYHRAAGHHIETPAFSRTLDGVLDFELIDVVMPRGPRHNHAAALSGTIVGTFVADITFERGDVSTEEHIEREFTIILGDGEGDMLMNGQRFRMRLDCGELVDE